MSAPKDTAFEQWLAAATEGIPASLSGDIRAELEAHYEDALSAYSSAGYAIEAAHAEALANLGDARVVRRMLHHVHLSRTERLTVWLNWLVPRLWHDRAVIGTVLFGVLALSVVVSDHRHWISYRGHVDPLTPLALLVVIASLLFERRLCVWSYAAVGYLLTGIWPWLFFGLLGSLNGAFWQLILPVGLPSCSMIVLAILGLRKLRRGDKFRTPPLVWLMVALTPIVIFAMMAIQLTGDGVTFRPSALSSAEISANALLIIYESGMLLAPVAVGLLLAPRTGVAAVLLPLASHYSLFVGIADPSYHLTFYDYWQPTRTLHIAEALVTYLPALMTFLIAPLWMLRARRTAGRAAAALVPTATVLVATHVLSAIGLQHTWEAYTATSWVSSTLETLAFLLPIVLAVVLYSRFTPDAEDREPYSDALPLLTRSEVEHLSA